jgi:hypothetical protein
MTIPPFLIALVTVAIAVQIAVRIRRKGGTEMETYMREEAEAEQAPDRPVPEDAFFTPDISELPLDISLSGIDGKKAERIRGLQDSIRRRSSLKMLRFPERFGNTQLKKLYGGGNLIKINTYEDHFSGYAFAVISLGRLLMESGRKKDAEACFRHCVSMPCEQTEAYISLAGILGEDGRATELKELRNIADSADLPAKDKALAAIDSILQAAMNTTEETDQ